MMSSPNTQNQEIDDIIEILSMDDNDSIPELTSDSSDLQSVTTSDDEITEHETSNEDSDGSIESTTTIEPIPLHVDADILSESKVEEKQEEEKEEKKEEEKEETPSCAVCYTSLNVENIVNTTCNHKYCKKCFFRWMKTSPSCPLCRKNLVSRSQWYENCDMNAELTELQSMAETAVTELTRINRQLTNKTILNENLTRANKQMKIWNQEEMRRKISLREDIDYSRGYLKALNENFPGFLMREQAKKNKSNRYCHYMIGYFAGYYNRKEITGEEVRDEFKKSLIQREGVCDDEQDDTIMNNADSAGVAESDEVVDDAGAVCM